MTRLHSAEAAAQAIRSEQLERENAELEQRIAAALNLHQHIEGKTETCRECVRHSPCPTRRVLEGKR